MRSRFASLVALLVCYVAMMVASPASAQIEFASSTLEPKPASEPTVVQPPAASEQVVPERTTTNLNDPAPVPGGAPNEVPENHASDKSARAANHLPTVVEPQFKNHSRPLVNPYTSSAAQTAISKMPPPMPVQPVSARQPARLRGKPYQTMQSEPAISPYMSLYQNNSNQNQLLNYYTIVRPQMEQIEANKKQEAEIQKLRAQVQNATQGGAPRPPAMGDASGGDGMTVSAHYMDTAQFYHRKFK